MDRRGALIVLCLAGCARELPPLPEVLLSVDTDLSVPRTITRLRVDVYAEDGTWLYSRDVPRIRKGEWPASFGVLSPDESRSTTVLVRLRAYPEGATRDYRGESYEPRPDYAPPHVAASIDELCAEAQDLPPLTLRTLRRGKEPLTTFSCAPTHDGSAAVRVQIMRRDTYRFEVVDSVPTLDINGIVDTSLAVRKSCTSSSDLACNHGIDPDNYNLLSRVIVDLDPGTYFVVTGGDDDQPADVTLRWGPASTWVPVPRAAPPPTSREVPADPNPRLVDPPFDLTPSFEPLPAATIDRLVRVRLTPGVAGTLPIVLRGVCAGTMAKLPAASATRVDADAALTCLDDPESLVPPTVLMPEDTPPPRSVLGTFLAEPCAPEESDDQVVCVPGGDTVLGGPEDDGLTALSGLPVRVVGVHKFWIDRTEATVGRYRQARAAGFVAKGTLAPLANDGPLADINAPKVQRATYTSVPRDREAYPLNTVSWSFARQFCEWSEGALPSEVQWEYAAVSAGRASRAAYPWGEDPADCTRGVVNRALPSATQCKGPLLEAVDSPAARGDVNALGILGLASGLSEWTMDAGAPYDAPCWRGSGAIEPGCVDPEAPLRVYRGGSFAGPFYRMRAISRDQWETNGPDTFFGVRCAYARPPSRRWSGR
jgi:formylglycine-generating enzyme required for sulfatase activity